MPHSKTAWTDLTVFTTTNMNNLEAQYADTVTDFNAHNHDASYYTRSEMEANFWYEGNDGAGSGCDADQIYTASGNKHYADLVGASLSIGSIIMWEGSIGSIPSGWALCNGSGGTIDLRDQWIMGTATDSGATYDVGDTGGTATKTATDIVNVASYTLTYNDVPNHTHDYSDWYSDVATGSAPFGIGYRCVTNTRSVTSSSTGGGGGHGHTWSGAIQNTENRPESVALYYIQRVS